LKHAKISQLLVCMGGGGQGCTECFICHLNISFYVFFCLSLFVQINSSSPPYTHPRPQLWRKWAHDFYDEDRTQYFMGVWIIASYAASIVDAQMMNPAGSESEQTANKGRNSEK
jgi:hypothetical protein